MLKCASSKNGTILALSYMHESDDIRVMKSSFSPTTETSPFVKTSPLLHWQFSTVKHCLYRTVSCLESSFIYWTIFQPVLLPIEQSLWSGFWSRCVEKLLHCCHLLWRAGESCRDFMQMHYGNVEKKKMVCPSKR